MARVIPLILAAGACAAVLMPSVADLPPMLVWNASPSVPIGLYFIQGHQPARGEVAALKLPAKVSLIADERKYLPVSAVLLKPTEAIEGDVVCRFGTHVFVNGGLRAKALRHDRKLRPLPIWKGCLELRSGLIFVLSRRKDSFDSRYIGPVEERDILGTARPAILLK